MSGYAQTLVLIYPDMWDGHWKSLLVMTGRSPAPGFPDEYGQIPVLIYPDAQGGRPESLVDPTTCPDIPNRIHTNSNPDAETSNFSSAPPTPVLICPVYPDLYPDTSRSVSGHTWVGVQISRIMSGMIEILGLMCRGNSNSLFMALIHPTPQKRRHVCCQA